MFHNNEPNSMKLCRKSYKHFINEVFFQLCKLTPIQLFDVKVFTLEFTTSSTFVITPCTSSFSNFVSYMILWSNDGHEIDFNFLIFLNLLIFPKPMLMLWHFQIFTNYTISLNVSDLKVLITRSQPFSQL
jgi:hypothetical protein